MHIPGMNKALPELTERAAKHLVGLDNANPFPGLVALEQRTGYQVEQRLGGNESLDAGLVFLQEQFGESFCELARLYPDPSATALRLALERACGINPRQVCFDSGADGVIALCLRAFCAPGDKVVCTAGTYPTFAYFARASGCKVVEVPYQQGDSSLAVDLAGLLRAVVVSAAKVVYLANPDNPTGSWWSAEAVAELLDNLPLDCTLLLDEAYVDFCPDLQRDSERVMPGCVRIRSLSKSHGLAGLRLGYALADESTLALLQRVRIHYAVSGVAQYTAQQVLDHPHHGQSIISRNSLLRDAISLRLREAGYRVLPSGANFVCLVLPSVRQAQHLQEHLLEHRIAVHRPAHPALANLIRVTVCEAALADEVMELFEGALG